MRCCRGRETIERITAFQHRDDAPAREAVSDLHDDTGEIGEVIIGEGESAQEIADAGIEAC